jgi:hypothetical protein
MRPVCSEHHCTLSNNREKKGSTSNACKQNLFLLSLLLSTAALPVAAARGLDRTRHVEKQVEVVKTCKGQAEVVFARTMKNL